MTLREALSDLSEVIFPPQCLGCTEILYPFTDQMFCSVCNDKIKYINGSI
jgi:hypothetical protein